MIGLRVWDIVLQLCREIALTWTRTLNMNSNTVTNRHGVEREPLVLKPAPENKLLVLFPL